MKLSFTGFNIALVLLLVPGIARAENPDLMTLIGASSAGSTYASRDNSGNDMNGNASTYGLSSSDHNSFAVDYGDRGIIHGHGRCSTRAGIYSTYETYNIISSNFVDSLTDETGQTGAQYCYCGLDSYTASGGSAQSLSGPWVYRSYDYEYEGDCADSCAADCAWDLEYNELYFRAAVFNAYAPSSSASGDAITTRTYVDNLLSGKQAKITTTGTNKLMTYGASTGATPGSRDIVSTLGTSTTATTVPEVGPIVTGLNGKQNTVNGTANFVMTGTGTAGTVGEKPVYSASVQKSSALVTAQTINTAAMDAANSEMMCHTYVANASQTPENCLLWSINQSISTPLPAYWQDPTIQGTSMCSRNFTSRNTNLDRNDCGNSTLNYLGAQGNRSGKWGVVFPYGELSGKAVCSAVSAGASGEYPIATEEQTVTLNSEYNTESNRGGVATNQKNCWCKMENPVAAHWVGITRYGNGSKCFAVGACVEECMYVFRNGETVRAKVFGLI